MAHYIDKDSLIAEIDRRVADNKKDIERASHKHLEEYFEGYEDALCIFKEKFLNALEVKEVDIKSEISNWWNNYYTNYTDIKNGYTFEGYSGHYMINSTIISLAEHFFELGLKAQK